MSEVTILHGPLLRLEGDPFARGPEVLRVESDGALAMEGGIIRASGPAAAILAAYPNATLRAYGPDRLIAPGFVDCHVHYPQIGIIASFGEQLLAWLNRYTFPEESRFGDPAYAAEAAEAFFAESLRHGITTSAAFCTIHPESVEAYFTAAERRGLRAVGGKVMMDRNAPESLRDTAQSGYDQSKALLARWHGRGRAVYAVTPRFAPTSTPEQLEASGALWREHPDCPMQTHLSENTAEVAWMRELYPEDSDYLGTYERFGLVGPGALFGHAIHLTEREKGLLAETGAAIAHCPTSNLFIGSGACAVKDLRAQGVKIGLATDVGGGSSFSPFSTMRAAYEVGWMRGSALSAAHLWSLMTQGSAGALRLDDKIGALSPGHEADAVVLDLAATPLLKRRTSRAHSWEEILFALVILGDDRAVLETWANGALVHAREDQTSGA